MVFLTHGSKNASGLRTMHMKSASSARRSGHNNKAEGGDPNVITSLVRGLAVMCAFLDRLALRLSSGLDSHRGQKASSRCMSRISNAKGMGTPGFISATAIRTGRVHKALMATGYTGRVVAELKGGYEAYLHDLSQRMDRLVLGRA